MNIETRSLTEDELSRLITEAPDTEKRNLLRIISKIGINPFAFFKDKAVENSGIIIDNEPIYFGALTNSLGKYYLWTIVNGKVKYQYSLFKIAKRMAKNWAVKYGKIYAQMEKNKKHTEWVERIGFKAIEETKDYITFSLTHCEI
jgi:hypothetical protein